MPPREETRRCTVTAASGRGAGPARRTPWSRCRWCGGMGQGRVRHSTPSWVRTCISWPSRRRRARCPASGEPTRISRFSNVIPPMPLTSRSTSTHRLAASAPGEGPAGGGPAGRPSARRSRARSTSDSRDGTVLTHHPPMLRCTVVASIQRVTFCPARAVPSQNCCGPTVMFPLDGTTRSTSTASGQLTGSGAAAASSAAGAGLVSGFQVSRRPQAQRVTVLAVVRGGTGRRGWPCPATGAAGHRCIRARQASTAAWASSIGGERPSLVEEIGLQGLVPAARPSRWWSASRAWSAAGLMPFLRQIRSNSTSAGRGLPNRPVNCLPLSVSTSSGMP